MDFFQGEIIPAGADLAGWAALVRSLGLQAPVRNPSCISEKHVGGSQRAEGHWRIFDKRYRTGAHVTDHLNFALRHETIDLLILKRTFDAFPPELLADFITATPSGTVSRRLWFFYEFLTGNRLDIRDAPNVAAVDAIDPDLYFTASPELSKRHRVRNNLLGGADFCPVIRRTKTLTDYINLDLATLANETIGRIGGQLVARAASFMLLADSRASFEIEGERAPRSRIERWGRAVLEAGKRPLKQTEIYRLHRILLGEDTRFTEIGYRSSGVFLGDRDHNGDPLPEFIGTRPEDLAGIMAGLNEMNNRMRSSGLAPVLQATAVAFGFVYVHPLADGNGRLHRCLIHHVLAERKFTPPGMVFPVSSVMLDRIEDYRNTLRAHSAPLMDFIEWRTTSDQNIEVTNDTIDLYRYFDCTAEAEFLYSCVERTVQHDLPREIDYLTRHDHALHRIMNAVEMPDRTAESLILFIRQNAGSLSRKRRENEFAKLTDSEVADIERIVRAAFEDADVHS